MRSTPSICALALSALLLGAASAAAASPPAEQAPDAIIPLYISSDWALAILYVGDRPPAPVVFDTGTTDNILSAKYAGFLGLKSKGPAHIVDAATGKPVPGFLADVPHARLSEAEVVNPQTEIIDYERPDRVGVFGPNSFSGRLVILEFADSQVRVRRKAPDTIPAGPAFRYAGEGDEVLPSIDLALPGMTVRATLDTGNTAALILPLSLASKLPLEAPPRVVGQALSASGAQDVYGARLKGQVHIGPVTLDNPDIEFFQGAGGANVGLQVLRKLKVVLDPAERRDWVLPLK
jgi:hypothetical protein